MGQIAKVLPRLRATARRVCRAGGEVSGVEGTGAHLMIGDTWTPNRHTAAELFGCRRSNPRPWMVTAQTLWLMPTAPDPALGPPRGMTSIGSFTSA